MVWWVAPSAVIVLSAKTPPVPVPLKLQSQLPEEFWIRTEMKLQVVLQDPGVWTRVGRWRRRSVSELGETVTMTGGLSGVVAESRPGGSGVAPGVVATVDAP